MWPFKPRARALPHRPLPTSLRAATMVLLWFSALPLLLSLPPLVAAVVWLIPGATSALTLMRPLPRFGLVALMGLAMLAILTVQSGSGDVRATGLGLLVAVLLMKASEMRTTRDGYNAAGFSLICPFVAFVMDIGVGWTTVVAAISLVGTMVLAGMITEWQDRRPVRSWGWHLKRVGILATLATPVAAAAFWLVPRLDAPLWGMGGDVQAQTGMDDSMAPGDVSNLMKDPSTAFRVEFEGEPPPASQLYWRGMTLGHFDGRAWTPAPLPPRPAHRSGTKAPTQPQASKTWRYSITMEPTRKPFVFVLEHLVGEVGGAGQVLSDNTVRARTPIKTVTQLPSLVSAPDAKLDVEPLSELERAVYTQLPDGYNPQTRALVEQWKEEGLDDQAIMKRALEMFSASFTYSLNPPLLGRHSVDEFLFDTQMGYCEHYSSSFAVIMRQAGVPTRVVIGYHGGEENRWGGYWRVRQADAHAWNEVWLEGQGWTRVDPTSAAGERTPSEGQQQRFLRSLGGNGAFADWIRQSWASAFRDFDAQRQRELLDKAGLKGVHPALVTVVVGVVLALIFGAIALAFMRERQGRQEPELRAWHKLVRRLEKQGFEPKHSETPLALAQRVAQRLEDPAQAQALQTLAQDFCAWRYESKPVPGLVRRLKAFRPGRKRK